MRAGCRSLTGTALAHLSRTTCEIDGVTCIVRARTWSIQMKDTTGFTYDDIRVIGGNPGNANQDGIDWIGSSDGLVKNSFLRASDDDIALMGNWDGYTDADMLRPGRDVQNIIVERQPALHQHLQHCPFRVAAQNFQFAQLYAAQLRHSPRRHRRMRPNVWHPRHVGRKRLQG